jgi:hypothetical protein
MLEQTGKAKTTSFRSTVSHYRQADNKLRVVIQVSQRSSLNSTLKPSVFTLMGVF